MTEFAKIVIASDGAQVLIFKDNGDEGPEVVFMTEMHGVTLRMGMGYEDDEDEDAETKRNRAFEESATGQADAIRKVARQAVKEQSP